MNGTGSGSYEFGVVQSVNTGTITLTTNLTNSYTAGTSVNKAQVVRVPQYTSITLCGSCTLTGNAWNDAGGTYASGGVLVLRVTGLLLFQAVELSL